MANKQHITRNNSKEQKEEEAKKLLLAGERKKKAKDTIVDEWLIENFKNRLKKAAVIVNRLDKPLLLYSNILEESQDAAKEEIILHNHKYITVQTFTRGGFVPTSFQEQYVFTIDKFITWIIKERKNYREIILQCLDSLHNIKCR